MRSLARLFLFATLSSWSASALAHKASTSYLHLHVDGSAVTGRWDIALRDLDFAIGLDANGDGKITWGEVRSARDRIATYALAHLQASADGADCPLLAEPVLQIVDHSDGAYAVLSLNSRCAQAPTMLTLDYSLLFEVDALHRGLLEIEFDQAGKRPEIQSGLFAPDAHRLEFRSGEAHILRVFGQYFRAGLFHVWSGLDHLLFLAGLFLPAVVRRKHGQWLAVPSLKMALRDTAFIVTAFTIAHACTLTLAATGAFTLPSRWVESAVALTVFFAAFNNIVPMVYRELVWLSGGFGLIHGAAVASALIDLGLPAEGRVWALLAFNLGVEAAQLSLLALVIPPTFYFRKSPAYRNWVLLPGSAIVALVGMIWFIERAFNVWLGVRLP